MLRGKLRIVALLPFTLACLNGAVLVAQSQPDAVSGQPNPGWQSQMVPNGALHPQSTSSTPPQAPPATSPATEPAARAVPDPTSLPPSALQLPAHRAVVRLGNAGLYVKAENSNLSQILRDIASATGTKVSGLGGEERIFGTYGPGRAEDVMNALLYGSDYNVLMVGNIRAGAPRELVLTRRSNAPVAPVANASATTNDDDSDAGTAYEDQDAPPPANAFPPGQARLPLPPPQNATPTASQDEPVKTPQQLLEQLQQLHRQNGPQNGQQIDPQLPVQPQ